VLRLHPAVADVTVIGLPDARTGERVCAVVVLQAGESFDMPAMVEVCRSAGLARYKHQSSWRSSRASTETPWARSERTA